jgi:hypothetical protein
MYTKFSTKFIYSIHAHSTNTPLRTCAIKVCATKYASQIFDVGFASKRPLLCGVVAPRRLEAGNPHTLMQKISFNARIDTLYHGKEAVIEWSGRLTASNILRRWRVSETLVSHR